MKISRRDLFKFVGGSAVGAFLTPVPWKLIDDAAIWSQNWSWIPKPLHGEVHTKFTTCTLCPAGCGVRAKCVGDQPVMLTGVSQHPVSHGTLCPVGLGGHHLPYHPRRATQPIERVQRGGALEFSPVSLDAAVAAVVKAISEANTGGSSQLIAVLDQQPGRIVSAHYQQFLGRIGNGIYLTPPAAGDATLNAVQAMFEKPSGPLGYDLENTRTILSFGAPILDGWGTPGRVMEITKTRMFLEPDKRLKIIQVETRQSRTALFADDWIPINPGTETAFALGLAHVLIHENFYDADSIPRKANDFKRSDGRAYLDLVERFTPDYAAGVTGIAPDRIIELARNLAHRAPAILVGGGDPGGGPLGKEEETAIAGLNFLLGSVGRAGGIVPRREVPDAFRTGNHTVVPAMGIGDVPDHSLRVLILDAAEYGKAIPWGLVERKLVPGATVVSLSPYLTGPARRADFVIPSPTYLESLQDVPVPADSAVASFSLSSPLMTPPPGATEPLELMKRLAAAAGVTFIEDAKANTLEARLKQRVAAIHKSRRGSIFNYSDGKTVSLAEVGSADQLWKILLEGGCWTDSKMEIKPVPNFSLMGKSKDNFDRLIKAGEGRAHPAAEREAGYPLVLMPFGWHGATGNGQLSPIMTKLYQESGLRKLSGQAAINPVTGKACGLADASRAWIETQSGSAKVEVRLDAAVMPGVVEVAVGPDTDAFSTAQLPGGLGPQPVALGILAVCNIDSGDTWRVTRAKVHG